MAHLDRYQDFVASARQNAPRVAMILGSGLHSLAQWIRPFATINYADIPDMPATTVAGHPGSVTLGTWEGVCVLLFAGRLHRYEGHPPECIIRPVHVARELGARILLATNSSGGIADSLLLPCLLAVTEHMDCSQPYCWRDLARRRRPGQSSPYSPALLAAMDCAAAEQAITLRHGVYAQVSGPNYETPAEVRALRVMGADVVGMSTVCEIDAARTLGMECAAISAVTNLAAGLADRPLNHDEVLANAARLADSVGHLLAGVLRRIG